MSNANLQILIQAKNEAQGALAQLNRDLRESGTSSSITATNARGLMNELNKANRAQRDIDRLDRYIKQLGGSAETSQGRMSKLWSGMQSMGGMRIGGFDVGSFAMVGGVAGAAALAVTKLTGAAGEAMGQIHNLGEEVDRFQDETGATAETASGLLAVFKRYDVDSEAASRSLGIFSKGLRGVFDESEGGAAAALLFSNAIDSLDIKTTDATGKLLPMDQLLFAVADKFHAMPDGIIKTADATALFGRSGKVMLDFLSEGSDSIKEQMATAKRYGVVLSQDTVDSVRRLTLAQKDLDAVSSGLAVKLGLLILPLQTGLIKGALDAQAAVGNLNNTIRDHSTEVSILAGLVTALGARYALSTTLALGYAVATRGVALATGAAAAAQAGLNMVMLANPIALVAAAVVGLSTAAVVAYKTNDQFADSVDRAMQATDRFNSSLGQIHPEIKQFTGEMMAAHVQAQQYAGGIDGVTEAMGRYLGILPKVKNAPIAAGIAADLEAAMKASDKAAAFGVNTAAQPRFTPQEQMDASDLADSFNRVRTAAGLMAETDNKAEAAAQALAAANKAASEASAAASKAETEANRQRTESLQQATTAVQSLQSAMNDLNRTPLLGQGAFDEKQAALQARIDQIDAAQRELALKRGSRSELRTLARERADLESQLGLSESKERAVMGPQQRTLQQALNPSLPEMSLQDLLSKAAALKGGISGAEKFQAVYQENHVTVTVNPGGGVDVQGGPAGLGDAIAEGVNQALAAYAKGGSGAGQAAASPALAGGW